MSRQLLSGIIFAASMFIFSACGQPNPDAEAFACAVREYQEQAIVLDKPPSMRKAAGLPPDMTNFTAFHSNWDSWLIDGFVRRRDRRTLRLEARPVESFAELDPATSFLVVVASQDFKVENVLSKYFEGIYRNININAACPIYVGERNGAFALATHRVRRGSLSNETYRECAVGASLAYFGLPDSELSNFENYIKPDLLPTMWLYDTEKIRSFLLENANC